MKRIQSSLLVLLALMFSCGTQAAKSGETFGDWTIVCVSGEVDGIDHQACHMFQRVTERESQQFLVSAEVGYIPGQTAPLLSITVPLGIAIPPGVVVEIDGDPAMKIPLGVCVAQGCRTVNLLLSEEALSSFKKGKAAKVIVKNLQGRDIAIPLSLSGFSKAVAALKAN